MKHCPQCQRRYAMRERSCPLDGALLSLPDPYHLVGRTLAEKYRVEALIGLGGMGAVYRAYHLSIERPVALKILQPDKALGDEQWLRLFEREAKLAGRLVHENIASVIDAGRTADGLAYLVMEWLDGVTLQDELTTQGPLSFARTAEILEQIVAALAAAHAEQIVHRDLKPANVMLVKRSSGGTQVKVLDFGIAKAATAVAAAVSAPLGTPQYASPEQFQAGSQIDGRSDIYSLGVLLYQMLTGKLPFEAASLHEIIQQQMTAPPPPLRKLRPDAPLAVEQLINRMLAKDPAQRPAAVAELPLLFTNALAQAQTAPDTLGIGATPPTQATMQPAQLEAETNRQRLKQTTAAELHHAAPPLDRIPRATRRTALFSVVVLLLLITAGFWYWRNKGPGTAALRPAKTLAVLPFKTLSTETEDQYLSFGLTDALITRLSNLRQITVRPTTAVLKYAKAEYDPRTTGRELEVEVLLDGRIQRVDDRIRVTVQLLNASDGAPQWAETFDERSRDLLKIQDDISAQVAAALLPQLTGAERQQLIKHQTENTEAYRLYLQARLQWEQRSQEGFKRGLDYIRQALEKDPNYALAHAGLASSYALFSLYGFLPPREGMPQAKAAAQRALVLDETLAEAHVALGVVFTNYDWNWVAAERAFRRAGELNPNLPMGHHAYALTLAAQARFAEARNELQRAQQLDPRSLNITAARAWIEHLARADKQALAIVEEALPLNPSFYPLLQQLGQAQARLGHFDAAIRTFQQARQRSGNSVFAVARLGHVYAQAGRRREAERVLAELKESATRSYGVAWVYLGLGEREQALTWLEKACDEHASEMIYLKTDPLYDDLRQETRFAELLRRVGLTP